MSHTHIRAEKSIPPAKPQYALLALMGWIVIGVAAWFLWSNLRASEFWDTHSSSEGSISETRIVLDHIRDSQYGGGISYRLEAHVSFTAEGHAQDRWLIVPEDSTDREWLIAKVATQPKTCKAYWPTGHPESAKCTLR